MLSNRRNLLASAGLVALLALPAQGAVPPQELREAVAKHGFSTPELHVAPSLEMDGAFLKASDLEASERPALQDFLQKNGAWEVRWDRRNDRPHLLQGEGVPLIPGRANDLALKNFGVDGDDDLTLTQVETAIRAFLADNDVLRVAEFDLRLDPSASAVSGTQRHFWSVELQQFHDGIPVEGANAFFRVSHGNLVQFGVDRLAEIRISTTPEVTPETALRSALKQLEIDASVREFLDPGTLVIYPAMHAGGEVNEKYDGAAGLGYEHRLVWRFTYFLEGDEHRYQILADARTGEVLEYADLTHFAQVQGDVYPTTNTDPLVTVPFPYAAVFNGSQKVTDANGNYNYSGGVAETSLNGRYIRINDNCGSISLTDSSTGDLDFGGSVGTDCTTPGYGGAGNTHAARSGFYHLTNINRKAATFLPTNNWLNGTLTANMNINNTCNAFWNGSTVNFYRSGGGCANTGEIAAVFLHEWGHGMDENAGGAPPENGSGEALADTFAFLETKDACIGDNFLLSTPCHNCNSSCSGVRDIAAFSKGGISTIARPDTVTSNTGINCDRWTCPYKTFGIFPYQGPMGYEGHCESYIASGATWDLTQRLVQDHGQIGWAMMDDVWYSTLVPSKSAYRVASGGKCNPNAAVDGCAATNWYTVFLAADDDNGNLADGTPNGCRIWDEFDAHGIACGARPKCSGYDLAMPSPGLDQQVNTFTVYGAATGQTNYILWGLNPGNIAVPGCPGVNVGMADVNILANGPADANGEYAFSTPIPELSGVTVYFQSVELATCQVSDLIAYTWP